MFSQDLRFAIRTLAKNPAFTVVAIATMALGIGATATMFSEVNGVLPRPAPFREPDRGCTSRSRTTSIGGITTAHSSRRPPSVRGEPA